MGGETVHTFSSSCRDRGVMHRMKPRPHYKTPPSRPNVLTSKRLFFRSEAKETSSRLPRPLARWWERSTWRLRAPALCLGGHRPSGRLCTVRGKHCSPCRCVPWLRLVTLWLFVRAGLSPRVLKASSPRVEQLGDPLRPWCRRHQGHPSPTRAGVGRCGTLFARRLRLGAGIRMRRRRWAGWRPILPPCRPPLALQRRRRFRP
jgi:hypothetical protein